MSVDDGTPEGLDDGSGSDVTRRDALKKLGVAAGVAWSAPVVMSFFSKAAAAGSPSPTTTSSTTIPVDPECTGATCATFLPCASSNPDCVCATLSTGDGLCVPGSTPCTELELCGPDFACPPGFVCAVGSCCQEGAPVCVPAVLAAECPPDPTVVDRLRVARVKTGAGTFGG